MYRPFPNAVSGAGTFADVEATIRGLTQDYCTAFNTGNFDQVAALFTTDGYFMAPHREAAMGLRPIQRTLQQLSESGYEDLRLETVQVQHSGDIAIEIGRYSLAIRQPNGTTVPDRGKFLHAWRRLGAWLIVADCWNTNLPR